ALTEALFKKIRRSIGAEWDTKESRWHLVDRSDEPYSADYYERFRTKWFKGPRQYLVEAHILCRRLIELLLQVEDKDYNRLFYRLYDFLDETREELHLTGARRIFDKTRFRVDLLRNKNKNLELQLIVRQFTQAKDKDIIVPVKQDQHR